MILPELGLNGAGVPEWSKGFDSSSNGFDLVGSNPTSSKKKNGIVHAPPERCESNIWSRPDPITNLIDLARSCRHSGVPMASAPSSAAGLLPRPGHWVRQRGSVFSAACAECLASGDTQEAALRRQHAAAGSRETAPRRVVAVYSGDMKGLLQLSGHAGPNATFFCLRCYARLNQTNVAGIPHLRNVPEPWKSRDARDANVVDLSEVRRSNAHVRSMSRWAGRKGERQEDVG